MRWMILLIVASTLSGLCCGSANETGILDRDRPNITILFSFNPESYPRIIRKIYPQVAVWITQPELKYARTIYATKSGSKDSYWGADTRPYALPVWYGIRNIEPRMTVDAVTGATPSGESFSIRWNVPPELQGKTVDVHIEANIAFDHNGAFPKSAKAGETNFSEVNGQPSLVWTARLTLAKTGQEVSPSISGHGQVLGKDHAIYSDISKVTTAKGLFHYIKLIYAPGK